MLICRTCSDLSYGVIEESMSAYIISLIYPVIKLANKVTAIFPNKPINKSIYQTC